MPMKTCSPPSDLENGRVEGADYNIGDTITYKCDSGFSLQGSSSRTCEQSGDDAVWSGTKPKCESK